MNQRADRELEEWIDVELEFYVKGLINDRDYAILRRNLIDIARAERRRRSPRQSGTSLAVKSHARTSVR